MNELLLTNEIRKSPIGEESVFLGESNLITYADISTLTGVTQGTLINEGSGWLRFNLDGKELIVAKKPIRDAISWDHLNLLGCVFGTKIVTISGNQYKVRLLTGADTDPSINVIGYFVEGSHNSEWSRLFYPLVTDDSTLNSQYTGPKDPRYTNLQLGMASTEDGSYSWCQEAHPGITNGRVIRGYLGVSRLARTTSSTTTAYYGWRCCLELVS